MPRKNAEPVKSKSNPADQKNQEGAKASRKISAAEKRPVKAVGYLRVSTGQLSARFDRSAGAGKK